MLLEKLCIFGGAFRQDMHELSRFQKQKYSLQTATTQYYCNVWTAELGALDLISQYSESIRQNQTGCAIIKEYVRLTCMTMIDFATGCIKIFKISCFDLDDLERRNSAYVDLFFCMGKLDVQSYTGIQVPTSTKSCF